MVRKKEVTPKELALTAAQAIAKANPELNGVIETYDDRIDGLDEKTLGNGPFRGVPLLMKEAVESNSARGCARAWSARSTAISLFSCAKRV